MPEKRGFPLENPLPQKSLSLSKPKDLESYSFSEIDRLERKGVMRKGGKSERGKSEKGVVIFAMLRCYACQESSRVSFYYNDLPPYVKCQGCGQIYPFGSFRCWCLSNDEM
uniref:Uncharacterized protein n=1 Tax=viral metagenome TaxID=1070528 RepID=A0A6H1ZP08_9ZZZZ